MFKAKMISTTNPAFYYLLNKEGNCNVSNGMFNMDHFHTSYIRELYVTDNIVTVNTRNSQYKFEILDGTKLENIKLTDSEIADIEEQITKAEEFLGLNSLF